MFSTRSRPRQACTCRRSLTITPTLSRDRRLRSLMPSPRSLSTKLSSTPQPRPISPSTTTPCHLSSPHRLMSSPTTSSPRLRRRTSWSACAWATMTRSSCGTSSSTRPREARHCPPCACFTNGVCLVPATPHGAAPLKLSGAFLHPRTRCHHASTPFLRTHRAALSLLFGATAPILAPPPPCGRRRRARGQLRLGPRRDFDSREAGSGGPSAPSSRATR